MTKIDNMIRSVVDTSAENTAGGILNEWGIMCVITDCLKYKRFDRDYIDERIDHYETSEGFLVKASDFVYAFDKNNDNVK